MTFDPHLESQAIARQQSAAQDPAAQVRLVAGPGSGKSFSIEGRVEHLLRSGVPSTAILAASFTRNAAKDLQDRIQKKCAKAGLHHLGDLRVGTLHSVALRTLRVANLLTMYPVDPRVLDEWEMRRWIDEEFAKYANVTPGRAKDVREYHEAWWSTGQQNPANYIPAVPPITSHEQQQFVTYHNMQSGFYAGIFVGEIVRECVRQARANAIDPRALLGIDHLIVDEYQDLNPMDLLFVDHLVGQGVVTFVAGDDDQSVYSFRHASPEGLQTFTTRFPGAGDHKLEDCFRCTPDVLDAALRVLARFSPPSRIPKQLTSLYATAQPLVQGHAFWWKYGSPQAEAAAIATSCLALHAAGLDYGDIMILLGNRLVMASLIENELTANGVPFSSVQQELFRDTPPGRAGFSILRILNDGTDLVAYRNLVALIPQMGAGRCLDLTTRCLNANMGALDLYQGHIPSGVLTLMQNASVQEVRAIAGTIQSWDLDDTLTQRGVVLAQMVEQIRGTGDRQEWDTFVGALPQEATLGELCQLLYADNLEDTGAVLTAIHERLELPVPPTVDPDRVQVMTMHGAKGLSGKIVFIPGLEETVFPTRRRCAKAGLVNEGARLLYVSITRARAAVFLTGAHARYQNGAFVQNPSSRYLAHSGLQMEYRAQPDGVDPSLAQQIAATCAAL